MTLKFPSKHIKNQNQPYMLWLVAEYFNILPLFGKNSKHGRDMSFQDGANEGINRHTGFLCHISHIHLKVGDSDNS